MTRAKLANLIKLITVGCCILLFVLVCIIIWQYSRLGSLQARSNALDKQIAENSVLEAQLEDGIERRSDDSFVEQQARENLGMIKDKGESVYEEEE